MSSPHDKDDNDTLPRASHDAVADEKPALRGETQLKEVAATSVALEAAIAEDKPRMFSKGMIKLWMIMGIGYLVSTMNGFGTLPRRDVAVLQVVNSFTPPCARWYTGALTLEQTAPSWAPSTP